jgi:serine/threonine-protein kinase RsbT
MRTVESEIGAILNGAISEITQRSIFRRLGAMARTPLQGMSAADLQAVQSHLESSVRLFAPAKSAELLAACARALAVTPAAAGAPGTARSAARPPADTARRIPIDQEKDIAAARLEAWSEAVRIGFSKFTSVKVATAVSELARNIHFYAQKGSIELRTVHDARGTRLEIVAEDRGPGISPEKLASIYAGTFRSERGMGKGLVAVRKLVDEFALDTRPDRGTRVSCVFRSAESAGKGEAAGRGGS